VDALLVPASRSGGPCVPHLVQLAAALGCPLVLLCSKGASAGSLASALGHGPADVLAVDLPSAYAPPGPTFETTGLAEHLSPRRTDLTVKRNTFLLLSVMAGWERVLLVDDDMLLSDVPSLHRAAALLETYDVVSPDVAWFPDGSTTGHISLALGEERQKFITTGAMLVRPRATGSFFPHVYNEDWLYAVGDDVLLPVAVCGRATQLPYDPYRHAQRAGDEEFGELIALGVYWLLQRGGAMEVATRTEFWTRLRQLRSTRLAHLAAALSSADLPDGPRMQASLERARCTLEGITAADCAAFVGAWLRDKVRWRAYLGALPAILDAGAALTELGLSRIHRLGPHATGAVPAWRAATTGLP